jgi:SPP1 family predicted phage head-tail adaptor
MARGSTVIGRLRQRVTIQTRVDSESGLYSGLSTRTDKSLNATVWAKVEQVTGTAQVDSKNSGTAITHRITIRHRDDISEQHHEILYTDRIGTFRYLIQTVENAGDERNRFLILECLQKEKVGTLDNPSPEAA